jgi:hypothetical protein
MRAYYVAWSLSMAGSITASAVAQAPATSAPAATPAAPASAAPAPTSATPAPSNPYAGPSPEAVRLARQRWQMEILRARALARARQAEAGSSQPALAAEETGSQHAAHGDAGAPFAIGASWESPWYTDASYDVFSNKDVGSRFGLWAAYDVASLRSDTIAALELGWGNEQAKDGALLGTTLGSELSTNAFHAGAQLRWVPVDWLQPHARLAAGAALVSMALEASGQRFEDHGVSPFASLGLGCTLRTPTRLFEDRNGKLAALSMGLMLEGGYTLAAPLDFTAKGPGAGNGAIPLTDSKLGRLERSGPYARASIVLRF